MDSPPDLEQVVHNAWLAARNVPSFLLENEARFLGYLATCILAPGAIVEIGSFKSRSAAMLAKVAAHSGLGHLPLAQNGPGLRSLSKFRYKLHRSRIPRQPISPADLIRLFS